MGTLVHEFTMAHVKQELKRFVENTSIRGVPRILRSSELFLRVVWSFAVVTCTAVLIFLLVVLFEKFRRWPVNTKFGEDASGTNVFPDVTICSMNRFLNDLKDKTLLKTYFDDIFKRVVDKSSLSYLLLNSMSGFIINNRKNAVKDVNIDCPEFIAECLFYYEDWQEDHECPSNFTHTWNAEYYSCQTLKVSSMNIEEDRFVRGVTFVLNVGSQYEEQLPYDSTLTTSHAHGAVVSIHSPGTQPDMKRGFTVGPGTESVVKIIQTKIKRLDEPYNPEGCTVRKTLTESPGYTYSMDFCLEFCIQKAVYTKCGCIVHWLGVPESLEEAPFCGNITDAVNSDKFNKSEARLICALVFSFFNYSCEECKQPCTEMSYQYTVTSAPWPPLSYQLATYRKYVKDCVNGFPKVKERYAAYDYFDRLQENSSDAGNRSFKVRDMNEIEESLISLKLVMEKEKPFLLVDMPQYTWDVMISLIGGMLSLWLGMSVVTIFEVLEMLYHLAKRHKKVNFSTNEMSM